MISLPLMSSYDHFSKKNELWEQKKLVTEEISSRIRGKYTKNMFWNVDFNMKKSLIPIILSR